MTWLIPREALSNEQIRAVEMDMSSHRVVLGSPGAGKSMVVLHRAKHLIDSHSVSPTKCRVFVFTNSLKDYIQSAVSDLRIEDEVVTTFDHWCREFYSQYVSSRRPWGKRGPDFNAIRTAVLEHVRRTPHQDLINVAIVDEGQDLDIVAYEILKSVATHVTVFMDHKQQVFDAGCHLADVLDMLEMNRKNSHMLGTYRCSPYIADVAKAFIQDRMEQSQFREQVLTTNGGSRQMPGLYRAQDNQDELEMLVETVRIRVGLGKKCGIFMPTRRLVYGYAQALTAAGLDVEVPPQRRKRNDDSLPIHDFSTLRPKLMAYPSAKGLTFDDVLMPFLSLVRFPNFDIELLRRWIFVGITRATDWVYFSGEDDRWLFDTEFKCLIAENRVAELAKPDDPPDNDQTEESPEDSDLTDLF